MGLSPFGGQPKIVHFPLVVPQSKLVDTEAMSKACCAGRLQPLPGPTIHSAFSMQASGMVVRLIRIMDQGAQLVWLSWAPP